MRMLSTIIGLVLLLASAATTASAQDGSECLARPGDRGECSPNSAQPAAADLLAAARSATGLRLRNMLERGERLHCYECVPTLMERALTDRDAQTREYAAWWLRRRLFAKNMAFRFFRETLQTDADPVRRARAADALGEFLDPNALPILRSAAEGDADARVRSSSVSALGRLNHPGGNLVLAAAMADSDAAVRLAAVKAVNVVNFYREMDPLVAALGDDSIEIRREAALLVGRFRVTAAVPALAALLRGDEDAGVRRSAAWALGAIGGADARTALGDAAATESQRQVLDAIEVARRMRS